MSSDKLTRRTLLSVSLLGVTGLSLVTDAASAQTKLPAASSAPLLSPADPTAKALGYIENAQSVDAKKNPTYKTGQICANCLQWADKNRTAALAKCTLFPGKMVKNKGWCKVWVKAPGVA